MKNNPEKPQQKEQPEKSVLEVLELMGRLLVASHGDFYDECVEKLSNAYGPRPKDNDELMQALGMSPDDESFSWQDILEVAALGASEQATSAKAPSIDDTYPAVDDIIIHTMDDIIPTMDDIIKANRAILADKLRSDIVRLGLHEDATWKDAFRANSAALRGAKTSQ